MTARQTIIDCDPGTDDAIALFLALASPELDVRLVSVVGGNVGLDHPPSSTPTTIRRRSRSCSAAARR